MTAMAAALAGAMGEALALALAEANRSEELPEAAEALRRGGVEGLLRDQGSTVTNRFLDLARLKKRTDPEPPIPAGAGAR